jgi:hypothetical protein
MKKKLIYIAALSFGLFIANNAMSADFSVDGTSGVVSMAQGTGNNGPAFAFTPSTNVTMTGGTQAAGEGFAIAAHHSSVFKKNSGKMFGMASDSPAMYWFDISATDATLPTVATPWDSSVVQTTGWNAM